MAFLKITRADVARLRRVAELRGGSNEIRDSVQAGLCLRPTGRRLTWYIRYSTPKRGPHGRAVRTATPICSADRCDDPELMRMVVAAGRAALREGRDPMEAVRSHLALVLRSPIAEMKPSEPKRASTARTRSKPTNEFADSSPSPAGLAATGEDVRARNTSAKHEDLSAPRGDQPSSTDAQRLDILRARLAERAVLDDALSQFGKRKR
jgi:hypothetical protein